jgi:hypothetical protein
MRPAGTGLERILIASLRRSRDSALLAWPLACGSSVAKRTRAVNFANGVLHVLVADVGWRRELQALAPKYLATLNRYSVEKIVRIEFAVANKVAAPNESLG